MKFGTIFVRDNNSNHIAHLSVVPSVGDIIMVDDDNYEEYYKVKKIIHYTTDRYHNVTVVVEKDKIK